MKNNPLELINLVIQAVLDKKGHDIVHVDLSKINSAVTDNFIICHGASTTQVSAISDAVEKVAKEQLGEMVWHKEGGSNAEWILLDYVNVVVHIFHEQKRTYYNLEGLWADADLKNIPNTISPTDKI